MSDSSTTSSAKSMFCSIDGCDRPRKARGLCSAHYKRCNKNNLSPVSGRVRGICSIPLCGLPHSANGFCRAHDSRARNGSRMDTPITQQRETCSLDGCTRKHEAGGFCKLHYDRVRRGTPLDQPVEAQVHGRTSCMVSGCTKEYYSSGYCSKHLNWHKVYSLSPEEIYALPSKCMLCGSTDGLCIDHDHSCCSGSKSCGKCVRGVLCRSCNTGIGFLQDDVDLIKRAINYLENFSRVRRMKND